MCEVINSIMQWGDSTAGYKARLLGKWTTESLDVVGEGCLAHSHDLLAWQELKGDDESIPTCPETSVCVYHSTLQTLAKVEQLYAHTGVSLSLSL